MSLRRILYINIIITMRNILIRYILYSIACIVFGITSLTDIYIYIHIDDNRFPIYFDQLTSTN